LVWEKASKFDITIEIAPLPIRPPREGGKWFMKAVKENGVTDPGEWAVINRFRCHQQILFLLDVLDAGGKSWKGNIWICGRTMKSGQP
jgi:hypothetical protein